MFTIVGVDGKEYGPVSADKVRDWLAGGRANLQTRAKREGEPEWKTLADFAEFAAAAEPPPPPLTATPVGTIPVAAAPIDYLELADPGIRFVSFLIDRLIAIAVALPGLLMLGPTFLRLMIEASRGEQPQIEPEAAMGMLGGLAILCLASFALIIVQVWMLSTRGQTIAKLLMKIRVVKYPAGESAGFLHGWLLRNLVPGIIQCIPYLGTLFFIVDSCFIFGSERRCIHDLIAGTKVVKVKS